MKYTAINGFEEDFAREFDAIMSNIIESYLTEWNRPSFYLEIFNRLEERLAANEDLTFEIDQSVTLSGRPEIIHFTMDNLVTEIRDDGDEDEEDEHQPRTFGPSPD